MERESPQIRNVNQGWSLYKQSHPVSFSTSRHPDCMLRVSLAKDTPGLVHGTKLGSFVSKKVVAEETFYLEGLRD